MAIGHEASPRLRSSPNKERLKGVLSLPGARQGGGGGQAVRSGPGVLQDAVANGQRGRDRPEMAAGSREAADRARSPPHTRGGSFSHVSWFVTPATPAAIRATASARAFSYSRTTRPVKVTHPRA